MAKSTTADSKHIRSRRLNKVAQQKLALRKKLWPKLTDSDIWLREKADGWLSIPRAMPLVLRILDNLAPKGKPLSHTYFDLWCRTYDDAFVIVSKPREMAYFSGFSGERMETTWASRIRLLEELEFISIKEGVSPIGYILLYNPYHAIQRHYRAGRVQEAAYNALQQRLIEIRADDLADSD